MRSVAKRVGVTATALYRHFDNKEDLVGELIAKAFETFGTYLYRALSGSTPRERLERCGEAYLDCALEQREIYRTIFMSALPTHEGAPKPRDKRCDPQSTFQFLVDRIRECIASGDLRGGDPETLALTLWAHLHGLVSLQICSETRPWRWAQRVSASVSGSPPRRSPEAMHSRIRSTRNWKVDCGSHRLSRGIGAPSCVGSALMQMVR